ncbi:MAG: hypothetical protein AVDCRST_MAG88-1050 [uncultured Thermomicrobiales bacterium]|uniref:Uncharacterized protein n=1 Tax=uncultured Thermomicrobiales bacterium TaxID=1645740 RepID=A0A6J4UPQ1_9BACT|nr:MAG: hypothetical protein AVDCRST_MAG88-1050 [uncultured Thermomicrobiales bacterium]
MIIERRQDPATLGEAWRERWRRRARFTHRHCRKTDLQDAWRHILQHALRVSPDALARGTA